jgi:hypothetical protein
MSDGDTTEQKKMNEELQQLLSSIDLSDVKSKGIQLSIGGQLLKFGVTSEETTTSEEEIKADLKAQVNEKFAEIKEAVNTKLFEIKQSIEEGNNENEIRLERALADATEREKQATKKLQDNTLMPDITSRHARKGLSVVKAHSDDYGSSENSYLWLFSGTYWPKTYNGLPLNERTVKKMVAPIILEIRTSGEKIVDVIVRQAVGFGKFFHYHGYNDNDCWGNWKYSDLRYKTPDDIIAIAEKALAVLENINGRSLATSNPAGLPRPSTLEKNVIKPEGDEKVQVPVPGMNASAARAGVVVETEVVNDNVWSTTTLDVAAATPAPRTIPTAPEVVAPTPAEGPPVID